jgi:hypothetical protein
MRKPSMKKPTLVSTNDETPDIAVAIRPPDFRIVEFELIGTAPLMISRFSEKMKTKMLADHIAGSGQTGKKKAKPAKDVEALFMNARYISGDGWDGILCAAIRNALIRTCSVVGYTMTSGRQSLFVLADGFDASEGVPLVRIYGTAKQQAAGENPVPTMDERMVRNANGQPDVRIRPRWDNWRMIARVQYDADIFTAEDVTNLMSRAGVQNGLGEGRPFSKKSNGIDFGTFRILNEAEKVKRPRGIAA